MTVKYNVNGKIIAKKFKMAKLERAMESMTGFCRACGHEQDGCEPDARNYVCEACTRPQVYGAEELMMMMEF